MVDYQRHTCYFISTTNNAIYRVAGKDSQAGSRDGNLAKALFNQPTSVAVYAANTTAMKVRSYKRL